ncbi:MAG: hypothetical protein P8X95_02365 [Anaerolineales bacterium]|jgi:hypothetical protein
MSTTSVRGQNMNVLLQRFRLRRGLAFGAIIITALLAFEVFNYSTTDFALSDLLGDLEFLGFRWATILAVAFCGIDFAGIARLFTPEEGEDEPTEVWYLFGAWLLAATMNAMLTWWGVSIAILNHETLGNAVVARATLLRVVPIFVAVLVWLIRVLIIGTFSVAGDRLFSQAESRLGHNRFASSRPVRTLSNRASSSSPVRAASNGSSFRPAPKPVSQPESAYSRPEPTYHPVSMSPRPGNSARSGFQNRR